LIRSFRYKPGIAGKGWSFPAYERCGQN